MQQDPPAPDPSTNSSPIHTNNGSARRERPSRACTQRAAARMQAAAVAEANLVEKERKRKKVKRREKLAARLLRDEELDDNGVADEDVEEEEEEIEEDEEEIEENGVQCGKIITPLVGEAEDSQVTRWRIRSMWELASILNFLNVFRPLLNVKVEFSAEELETALLAPNNMLADIHMPILKAIPPVTRMALGHNTWITVLCRKLRDWWHWVAEGDLPIVASHGAEVEAYSALDPGVRVVILKALCDIRVEQDDIRNHIDDSIKRGVQLSSFRKQRIGGDSHGISYWYEEDPIIGHRLHREIRKVEVTKSKGKKVPQIPHSSYQWEAVATNLDEFQNVIEKLSSSKSRTEVSVAKKLTNDVLPEIEKVHKRKEKLLKKQHRQALMLDNMINMDDLGAGRSRRDRKPVTYTFDDYDRSINEAIKVTKNKQASPEPHERRDPLLKPEGSRNGTWGGEPSHHSENLSFSAPSPNSLDDELYEDDDLLNENLDRSDRRKQRPQRYSVREFAGAASDNDAGFDSDDDIVGEVVYDDAYLKSRKRGRKSSSNSEDEEYDLDQENHEEEEEEEEEDEDNLSTSEDSDGGSRFKNVRGRTRRESKLRSTNEFRSGLRRSKRATRNRINYSQIEVSDSETDLKPNASDEQNNITDNEDFSMGSQDSEDGDYKQEEINNENQVIEEKPGIVDTKLDDDPPKLTTESDQEEVGVKKRRFLDLNQLAPGSGFDEGPTKDEDADE